MAPWLSAAIVAAIVVCVFFASLETFRHWDPGFTFSPEGLPRFDDIRHDSHVSSSERNDLYLLGVGKGDITGPVVEINFMGYANGSQLGTGLRQRLYSRAFIVGDVTKPAERFVYLILDTQSGDTAIRHGILEALTSLGDEYSVYGNHNVAVTGTHSHSGPGAWLNYLLPQITSKGFSKASYQAIVDGAMDSIRQAHETLAPGHLSVGEVDIQDANINRSPYAYLSNPVDERDRYEHDVDKTLTMLRFTHATDSVEHDIGVLTWFAVHGTSMLGNNTLVTGDNKGVAAWLFEKATDDPVFVAGFCQANVGDTTPNVLGAYCEYGEQEGQLCDFKTSLCANKSEPCRGRGPYFGRDDAGTASTFEIGRRQFEGAYDLFNNASALTPIQGDFVGAFHNFVDMSNIFLDLPDGTSVRTCPAALGYSFAAGTSDGPGVFDFKQAQPNDPNANPLWSAVGGLIHRANATQKACHEEKVILLDVGEAHRPYDWTPNIVDIQLLRVGQMIIIVSPGEATTMAGRRWREAIAARATALSLPDPVVVLGGPANTYSHYITTREEYAVQRYEGASTLYGPHTLAAYIHLTTAALTHLVASDTTPQSSTHLHAEEAAAAAVYPQINTNRSLSFIRPVVFDRAGWFQSFGDVILDVLDHPKTGIRYRAGATVTATFVGANPRNAGGRRGGTFAAVERLVRGDDGVARWIRVRDDADWAVKFEWWRVSEARGTSEVRVSWETAWETGEWRDAGRVMDEGEEEGQGGRHGDELVRRARAELKGTYRLKYYGDAKAVGGRITSFEGTSGEFEIA